jgi:hypothetical protein
VAEQVRPRRYAVLIDADNARADTADGLFEEIAGFGEATVRRIYGDVDGPRLNPWKQHVAPHAIVWVQQAPGARGKNASDIALVIDAMDLLHGGRVDGFCLVSSDSDFTRLASRLREQGADVIGFGEQKTPESFRQACRRFIYVENLRIGPQAATPAEQLAPPSRQPSRDAIALLRKAMQQLESEDGWCALGPVGSRLLTIAPDFDQRTYGHAKLSDLVRATGAFDVEAAPGGGLRIRAKTPPAKPKARPPGG